MAAGLTAEAQFAIDLANARADETARELSVITARLRGSRTTRRRNAARRPGRPPVHHRAGPAAARGRRARGGTGQRQDAPTPGQIMRRVLTEYAQQARLLDLDVELGSPMDEPEDAGREQRDTSREDVVSRFKQMTGLK